MEGDAPKVTTCKDTIGVFGKTREKNDEYFVKCSDIETSDHESCQDTLARKWLNMYFMLQAHRIIIVSFLLNNGCCKIAPPSSSIDCKTNNSTTMV